MQFDTPRAVRVLGEEFSLADIERMELRLVKTLRWDVNLITPQQFIDLFFHTDVLQRYLQCDPYLAQLATTLCDLAHQRTSSVGEPSGVAERIPAAVRVVSSGGARDGDGGLMCDGHV